MKNIKKRILYFFKEQFKILRNKNRIDGQLNFNATQLSQLFPAPYFIPSTRWSISPSTILHVLNEIVISQKKCVIEFGSGNSTLFIAQMLKINKLDIQFYSVESNEVWIKKMKAELTKLDILDYVTILQVPTADIEKHYSLKTQKKWYNTTVLSELIKDVHNIDLVLVDAPEKALSPYSRYSAIPFLKNKLSEKCTVFIDDSDRPDEKEIVEEWSKILQIKPLTIERYTYFKHKDLFNTVPFQLE